MKKRNDAMERKENLSKSWTSRCNTCEMHDHDAKNCLEQDKGPKCFKCNTFGYIANRCLDIEKMNVTNINCISKSRSM